MASAGRGGVGVARVVRTHLAALRKDFRHWPGHRVGGDVGGFRDTALEQSGTALVVVAGEESRRRIEDKGGRRGIDVRDVGAMLRPARPSVVGEELELPRMANFSAGDGEDASVRENDGRGFCRPLGLLHAQLNRVLFPSGAVVTAHERSPRIARVVAVVSREPKRHQDSARKTEDVGDLYGLGVE